MPIFNDLGTLEKYLKHLITQAVMTDVKDSVTKVYKENILEEVYGRYSPTEYKRRYSLIQDDNIKARYTYFDNGLELFIYNDAPPSLDKGDSINPNYNPTPASLPELIEYGHDTEHGVYDYPFDYRFTRPRQFTKRTINYLENTNFHKGVLWSYLVRRGVQILNR